MLPRLRLPIAMAVALALGCLLAVSGCGDLASLRPSPTPTSASDLPHYDAERVKSLVAATLGPNPVYRPAQGLCYAAMTKPVVVPRSAASPGDEIRALADAIYQGNGTWSVRWSGGEWRVDERDGSVVAANDEALSLVAASNVPCPDAKPE